MKSLLLVYLLMSVTSAFADNSYFPMGPNPQLTPGKLCDKPTSFRYPQQIPYCDRDVTSSTKMALIKQYDDQLGFHIESMDRSEFKKVTVPFFEVVGGKRSYPTTCESTKSEAKYTNSPEPHP